MTHEKITALRARKLEDMRTQQMSFLKPALLLVNCLCLRFESQYVSSVSFEISIPMVSFICLFLTLSCHAGPKPVPRENDSLDHFRNPQNSVQVDRKDGGRPYSCTVHNDQEGNGPTPATARHN